MLDSELNLRVKEFFTPAHLELIQVLIEKESLAVMKSILPAAAINNLSPNHSVLASEVIGMIALKRKIETIIEETL